MPIPNPDPKPNCNPDTKNHILSLQSCVTAFCYHKWPLVPTSKLACYFCPQKDVQTCAHAHTCHQHSLISSFQNAVFVFFFQVIFSVSFLLMSRCDIQTCHRGIREPSEGDRLSLVVSLCCRLISSVLKDTMCAAAGCARVQCVCARAFRKTGRAHSHGKGQPTR